MASSPARPALALLSGLLLALAFPGPRVWPLAWVGLVPLLVALEGVGAGRAFFLGFLTGLVQYALALHWITWVLWVPAGLPLPVGLAANAALVAALAVLHGLFGWAVARRPGPIPSWMWVPAVWVGLEWVRGLGPAGLPVVTLGLSQAPWNGLIQVADLGGVGLLSFLVALGNGALASWLRARRGGSGGSRGRLPVGVALLSVALALWVGHLRRGSVEAQEADAPRVRVAAVQGNVPQARKWEEGNQEPTVETYLRLTEGVEADLVAWPETALPFPLLSEDRFTPRVLPRIRVPVLTGSPAVEGPLRFNRAWLLMPGGGVAGWRDKAHLVPFGEYVPFRQHLPFLSTVDRSAHDFDPAPERGPLPWNGTRVGVLICFESLFPALSRSAVAQGAGLLAVLTNDAWFGRTWALEQHLDFAILRAVENRRAVIQAANTGISGIVDPTGRVLARSQVEEEAVVVGAVPLLQGRTPYNRVGDVMGAACGALVLLALLGRALSRSSPAG